MYTHSNVTISLVNCDNLKTFWRKFTTLCQKLLYYVRLLDSLLEFVSICSNN